MAAIPKFQHVMLKEEEMFADNGIFLDSMEYITLIVNIENEFDIELEDEDLYTGFDSILELKTIILKHCKERGLAEQMMVHPRLFRDAFKFSVFSGTGPFFNYRNLLKEQYSMDFIEIKVL